MVGGLENCTLTAAFFVSSIQRVAHQRFPQPPSAVLRQSGDIVDPHHARRGDGSGRDYRLSVQVSHVADEIASPKPRLQENLAKPVDGHVETGAADGRVGVTAIRFLIGDSLPASSTVEIKVRVRDRESNTVLLPIE